MFINSFYNLKYALPHNYVITKFTGYARVLNYLDSGKFHVGKKPAAWRHKMRKVGFVCTVHSLKVYDFTRLHYVSRRRCCFIWSFVPCFG